MKDDYYFSIFISIYFSIFFKNNAFILNYLIYQLFYVYTRFITAKFLNDGKENERDDFLTAWNEIYLFDERLNDFREEAPELYISMFASSRIVLSCTNVVTRYHIWPLISNLYKANVSS